MCELQYEPSTTLMCQLQYAPSTTIMYQLQYASSTTIMCQLQYAPPTTVICQLQYASPTTVLTTTTATVVEVVALWPVDHASHARDLGSNPVCSGHPSLESLRPQCQPPSVILHSLWSVS